MPQSTMPQLVTDCQQAYKTVCDAKQAGRIVGLVPTMGALHEGHLSLVRTAKEQCDIVVVTIFVNPTQFGPQEDLSKYPRTLAADIAALAPLDVEMVFAPANEAIYPNGFSAQVDPPAVGQPLEGQCRPGHFRGVATVVLKLFHLIPANIAYFGQKDYQQFLVIRRMVEDLNVPIDIRVLPIVREPDGLALSSRNVYLSPDQRQQALALSASLKLATDLVQHGETDAAVVRQRMQQVLADAGITRVDYATIADCDTLVELETIGSSAIALIAAHVGATRLIDNCRLG